MNLQKLVNNGCAKYFAARASNAEGVSPIPLRARVLVVGPDPTGACPCTTGCA